MPVVEKGTWVKIRMDGHVVAVLRDGEPTPVDLAAHAHDDEAIFANGWRVKATRWSDEGHSSMEARPIVTVEVLVDPMSDVLWCRP